MRGLSRRALGDVAAADADIAEALRLDPDIASTFASYDKPGSVRAGAN
jgi:hypothetical protein